MILDLNAEQNAELLEQGRLLFAQSCDFMLGVANLKQLPDYALPEFAFIGRSNVGKSSLINALTGRKNLARTSVTPGRTQELNFFNLGNKIRIVDLPGYGFANAPVKTVKRWHDMIYAYLQGRPNLSKVFVLIDSRRGIGAKDLEMMQMLDDAAVSYQLILTKSDKVSSSELEKVKTSCAAKAAKFTACYPYIDVTSSAKGEGIAELRGDIFFWTNL